MFSSAILIPRGRLNGMLLRHSETRYGAEHDTLLYGTLKIVLRTPAYKKNQKKHLNLSDALIRSPNGHRIFAELKNSSQHAKADTHQILARDMVTVGHKTSTWLRISSLSHFGRHSFIFSANSLASQRKRHNRRSKAQRARNEWCISLWTPFSSRRRYPEESEKELRIVE
jgi:hypothetical protein